MTLLERERELSELTTALSDAWEGRGRFVLVEAPAGLGKSSLVRAALDDADGFTVLRARTSSSSSVPPSCGWASPRPPTISPRHSR